MENTEQQAAPNSLKFNGNGAELLGIMLLNWLLTSITFGIYYPWARVNRLKYFWENTQLNDSPFVFHGTGKELFKGFIKVLIFFVLFYAGMLYTQFTHNLTLYAIIFGVFFLCLLFIIPLAIHGALRYRLSRTSWRGIHMGYRGDRGQLITDFIMGYILVIITFGIYNSWFINKLRTYIIGNMRFGNLKFGYDGEGFDLFLLNLKGMVLSFITLGIYWFWYQKEWMNYYVDHAYITQEDKQYRLQGKFKGLDFLVLVLTNLLLVIFTLGLATPWVIVRTTNFMINHIQIPAEVDFNTIAQTEDEYKDAAGDDMIDFLDLGIV